VTAARLKSPRFLLGLIALLTAIAVQPGDLGSIDTVRRLQVTHWMWTSAPQVAPGEFPGFGVPGRNGHIYAWYGLGQSLLMLPGDVAVTALIHAVPALRGKDELRALLLSYSLSPLICTLAVLAAFDLLQQLGFSIRQSAGGALGLLFATTFLHYTQNMMENNLLLLLMLSGLRFQCVWLWTGSKRSLAAGSMLLGAGMLVRLTVALDCIAAGLFIAGALWLSSRESLAHRLWEYVKVCAPFYLGYALIDRAYHFYRFGQCCTNYIGLYGEQARRMDPSLPANFPYTLPFWQGFLGPLISPEKSVFLFDPLLIVVIVIACIAWHSLASHIKALIVAMTILLLAYMAFHARLFFWGGDVAWGDRYLTTPVQMLALLALPLVLRHGAHLGKTFWLGTKAIISLSVIFQIESLLMPAWVEFRQADRLGHPIFVIGRRLVNVVAFITGKLWGWQIESRPDLASSWSKSIYLYPFRLAHEAMHAPHWISQLLIVCWVLLLCVLAAAIVRLRAALGNEHFREPEYNGWFGAYRSTNQRSTEVIT
jgi:hypothetical protein